MFDISDVYESSRSGATTNHSLLKSGSDGNLQPEAGRSEPLLILDEDMRLIDDATAMVVSMTALHASTSSK